MQHDRKDASVGSDAHPAVGAAASIREVAETGSAEGTAVDGPSPNLRLDDQLCFALYSATNAVVRAYRPLLRTLGLTYPQYLVMMALWEREDTSLGDLAARLDLPLHGLSPVLERLHQAGLLDRRTDLDDRRVQRVTLTQTGRDLEQQAAVAQYQVRCDTELVPDDLARLREELQELSRRVSKHLH